MKLPKLLSRRDTATHIAKLLANTPTEVASTYFSNRSRKTLVHRRPGDSGRLLPGLRPEFETFYIARPPPTTGCISAAQMALA